MRTILFMAKAVCQVLTIQAAAASSHHVESPSNNPSTTSMQLPMGDVNVVVLTDVHAWVASHAAHEPRLNNADYGHVLSFYEHLQELTPPYQDTFFVMNGDFMDGTGLSTYPPAHLVPILQRMPWDAVNMGNHELYRNETVEFLIQPGGFVDHWNGNYLTSNILLAKTNKALGSRATFLYGKNTGAKILTFGFLYHFLDNCELTIVERVHVTIQSPWFQGVLTEGAFDAIIVLAHMDHQDHLVNVIHDAIRKIVGPDMPVQFLTGHSHVRGFTPLDDAATSFEAGHYLDTVGFASFPIPSRHDPTENMTALFRHTFIDANVETLRQSLGVSNLTTPKGLELTTFIRDTQKELGLLEVLGCSSEKYDVDRGLDESGSLMALYEENVVPWLFRDLPEAVLIQSPMSFRYSLMKGDIRWDDLIAVSPFNDTFYKVAEDMLGSDLLRHLGPSNTVPIGSTLPNEIISKEIDPTLHYDVYTTGFESSKWLDAFSNVTGVLPQPHPLPNTTTGLWKDYVIHNMQCGKPSLWWSWSIALDALTHLAIPLIIISGLVCWVVYRRRSRIRRRGYEDSLAQIDDLHLEPNYNTIL